MGTEKKLGKILIGYKRRRVPQLGTLLYLSPTCLSAWRQMQNPSYLQELLSSH